MSDMRHILIISRRYRERDGRRADERFNDIHYPCKITRVPFGGGIGGLPVSMIIFEDQPENEHELAWVQQVVSLRRRPDVVTVGWSW